MICAIGAAHSATLELWIPSNLHVHESLFSAGHVPCQAVPSVNGSFREKCAHWLILSSAAFARNRKSLSESEQPIAELDTMQHVVSDSLSGQSAVWSQHLRRRRLDQQLQNYFAVLESRFSISSLHCAQHSLQVRNCSVNFRRF